MFTVLSPAKRLNLNPFPSHWSVTTPDHLAHTEEIIRTTRRLSKNHLRKLMNISDNLASLTADRFQAFHTPFTPENAKPAALIFAGDTYVGLQADTLTEEDLRWAQDRLGILSGLYGLLRPLDLIQPYRLEMGTRLSTGRGNSLYDFWDTLLAETMDARVTEHADPTVVNLASKEYFSALPHNTLVAPVLTPVFKEIKEDKVRVISFMAKKARGAMARWIVENRIEHSQHLREFDQLGYTWREDLSTPTQLLFTRPQPPPARTS